MSGATAPAAVNVVVVVGFLGAGKSTLLGSVLRQLRSIDAVTRSIVNDFAPFNVDTQLLELASTAAPTPGGGGEDTTTAASVAPPVDISGGCICCTALPQFLVHATRCIAELRDAATRRSRAAWLLVESTGIGDAGPIADALLSLHDFTSGRAVLRSLCGVLSMQAAAQCAGSAVRELLVEQLRWCTSVVLTRTAEATEEERAATWQLLREAVEDSPWQRSPARVVVGDFGRVPLGAVLQSSDDRAHCVDAAAYRAAWAEQVANDGGEHLSEAEVYGFRSLTVVAGVGVAFDEDALMACAARADGLLHGVARSKGRVTLLSADGKSACPEQHMWASVGRGLEYAPVGNVVSPAQVPGSPVVVGPETEGPFETFLVFIGRGIDVDAIVAHLTDALAESQVDSRAQ